MPASTEKRNNFFVLHQDGPFAIKYIHVATRRSENREWLNENREWLTQLRENPQQRTNYHALRNQICQLLDITSFHEIPDLIIDKTRREKASKRAHALLGSMYGIEGTQSEIESQIKSYAEAADGVIHSLRQGILAPITRHIEMVNEVGSTHDIVELQLMVFDRKYSDKARFEAMRKIELIRLAGSIDQRERETKVSERFAAFQNFLDAHVWSSERIGDTEDVYLLSEHDLDSTNACNSTQIITEEIAQGLDLQDNQKLTLLKRRKFTVNGVDIPVYVTPRRKPTSSKILKLLRKGHENPALSVDDDLGLMAVLNSEKDIRTFMKHLTDSAAKAGTFITPEETEDKLGKGTHKPNTEWSSPYARHLKFFAKMRGMRVEFVLYTNESYVESQYRDEASHREYELRRFFKAGIPNLLFPQNFYHIDFASLEPELVKRLRKNTRADKGDYPIFRAT